MPVFKLSAFADEAAPALSDQLSALRLHGLSAFEIRGVDGASVASLTPAQAAAIRSRLNDTGIGLSAIGSPYGKYPLTEDFAPHLESFRRGLEVARILGAERIRMFSFYPPENADPAAYRSQVLDRLDTMLLLAADAGIELVHENEKGIYGDVTSRCADLMDVFFPRMGMVFDPANFIQCGVDPLEAFDALERYVVYMHIKDALKADGSVTPAGKGDGHVAEILRRLTTRCGVFTLTVEPHLKTFAGLDALQREKLAGAYAYPDSASAFAAAVDTLKDLLTGLGYAQTGNGLWRRGA